jgi:signal transduction histidine kinase
LNVVAVAIPIKTEHQEILGILVLQVRLDTLFEWTKGIDVGPLGFAYFVDKKGHVAAHPSFSPQGEIVDYSKVPAVQKVLQGKRGVEIAFNPVEKEERIAAYEPVPGYGWGVIAQQPTLTAFVARDSNLRGILIAYGSISLLSAVLAYLIVRAFTERKRAEEQTRKLNAKLEAANKELESFSYSVSHDLRAPLRHVAGYSELLKKHAAPSLDDKSVHYLNTIIESAGHMGNLIDDLLGFARIGRTEVQRTTMSLDELVQETLKELRTDMEGRTIAWKIDSLPRVEGDPPMLRLVFINLIANALKFTRTRPEAKIEISTLNGSGGEAIVFIRDNGVGFDMQYVDKLFGVFQRLHRADEFEGTGVGLASVRRIIERHGGRVWAEGSVGGGATFYLSLPGL